MQRILFVFILFIVPVILFGQPSIMFGNIHGDSGKQKPVIEKLALISSIDSCFKAEPACIERGLALTRLFLRDHQSDVILGDTTQAYVHSIRANFFHMSNAFDSALFHYLSSKSLYEKREVESPHVAYYLYRPLGMLMHKRGAFRSALDILNKAIEILKKQESHLLAGVYCETGNVYLTMKEYQLAITYYKKGMELPDLEPWLYCILMENSALCLLNIGKPIEAEQCFQKALEIAYTINDEIGVVSILSGLSDLFYKTSHFEEAIIYIKNALEKAELVPGIEKREIAKKRYKLGQYFMAAGMIDQAMDEYELMLSYLNSGGDFPGYAVDAIYDPWSMVALISIAECYDRKYKKYHDLKYLQLAYSFYEQAEWIANVLWKSYSSRDAKMFLSTNTQRLYQLAVNNCYELFQVNGEEDFLFRALQYSEQNKFRLLQEQMVKNPSYGNCLDEFVKDSIKHLNVKIACLSRDLELMEQDQGVCTDSLEMLSSSLNLFKEKRSEIVQRINKENPGMQIPLKQNRKIQYNDISEYFKVHTDESMIEFLSTDSAVFVFYLDRNGIKINKYNNIEKDLKYVVDQICIRPTLKTDIEKDKKLINGLSEIYNRILRSYLEGSGLGVSHLVVIPDHIWTYLPFEALIVSDEDTLEWFNPGNFLINKYSVSYVGSIALYNYLDENKVLEDRSSYAGFAPEFEGDKDQSSTSFRDGLRPLQYNKEEVEVVKDILGGKAYTGRNANLSTFLDEVDQNQIIHLATHSLFDSIVPMNSKLYFSDTAICLYEICQMQIPADLVILNACNTGNGKYYAGEGTMSISNGFIQTGSKSCLTNLWSVDDYSTSQLIQIFSQRLGNGQPLHVTLQETKITFLADNRKLLHHPYYWASNVLNGNNNLQFNFHHTSWMEYSIAIGLLLIIFFILIFRNHFNL